MELPSSGQNRREITGHEMKPTSSSSQAIPYTMYGSPPPEGDEMKVKKKPTKELKKNPVGRPPFYTDPAVMQIKMDEYFAKCDAGEELEVYDKKREVVHKIKRKIPYTVPGLVYHLGFGDDQALDYYRGKSKEFSVTITHAWKRIERQRNEKALTGDQEPRFAQFDLGHNFKWASKQDLNVGLDETALSAILSLLPSDYAAAVRVALAKK